MTMPSELPIRTILPELRSALAGSGAVVLSAPPGSGKTTAVPLALLEEPWLNCRKIIMLEPRRLAARMAATRMADTLGEAPGETVGYQMRFESRLSAATRIEVVTEGILIRRLQNDPELQGTGLIIFDEFHERNLNSDLALAFALDIRQSLRPDLRLLIMSATLDISALAAFLDHAPVVSAEAESFPVTVEYLPIGREQWFRDPPPGKIVQDALIAVRQALAEQPGDLLVFLPGGGEIRQAAEAMGALAGAAEIEIHPLYGDLPSAEQNRALLPSPRGRRKIVLATNIAETSLTIEGITTVVDTGWRRISRFHANTGLSGFETVRISRAAALQRANRAGRLGPGHCYRLWDQGLEQSMKPFSLPEIVEADLAPLALELAAWGVADPLRLNWLTPPPHSSYRQAVKLLSELEALDRQGRITGLGRRMAAAPVHPRLAHMILKAEELGLAGFSCDLAALLSERDILRKQGGPRLTDIGERLEILQQYRDHGGAAAARLGGDQAACARVEKNSLQLRKIFRAGPGPGRTEAAGLLLAFAFPDRIGQRRTESPGTYLLTNGRGARLPEHDRLRNQRYLAIPLLDAAGSDGRIFLAAPLAEAALRQHFASRIESVRLVAWDDKLQAVAAEQQEKLQALTLAAAPASSVEPEEIARAMVEGIRRLGLGCLPWDKKAVALRERLRFLHHHQPEAGWPDLSDGHLLATLELWLGPYLGGISRRAHLRKLDLEKILTDMLGWNDRQMLEREAPPHIQVPSGSRIRLSYSENAPPVLAVRIQEVFGLTETPAVAGGRVPVVIHLLSPAQRPMQVTQDLGNFWLEVYPSVKKELKGRYPKHHWPEDPCVAMPTARAKGRKK